MAIFNLLAFIGIIITIGIMSLRGHTLMRGDPYVVCILAVALTLYSLNSWKDKKDLFRRTLLAFPFGFLAGIALWMISPKITLSCIGGILLFNALIIETTNLKLHYIITLATAAFLIGLTAYLNTFNLPLWAFYGIAGIAFAVVVFYRSYSLRLSHTQKTTELWSIAVKSSKFAAVCMAAITLLTVSHILCRQYHLGLLASFLIAVLIALSFLSACQIFHIKDTAKQEAQRHETK